jgi:hypothetical protein
MHIMQQMVQQFVSLVYYRIDTWLAHSIGLFSAGTNMYNQLKI